MSVLSATTSQLNLSAVLLNGQSFRWVEMAGVYYGTARNRLWKLRRINDKEVEYSVLASTEESTDGHEQHLHDYLQMAVNIDSLYKNWGAADPHIQKLLTTSDELKGIRVLDQDPVETLFAFICSANNNIKRISKMVNRLCTLYGSSMRASSDLSEKDAAVLAEHSYLLHAFPTISQLASFLPLMNSQLRAEGFGYRAAYIASSVAKLQSIHSDHLTLLREADLASARQELLKLTGVGPKVADCICLMSLRKHSVVPIDTHVHKSTVSNYRRDLGGKSLTATLHEQIGQFYESLFGEYAGWAQAVLFNAQLAQKRPATGDDVIEGAVIEAKKTKKKKQARGW